MTTMKSQIKSQITSLTIVYSTIYSGAENTSTLHATGLCVGEFTGHRLIPRTKGQ